MEHNEEFNMSADGSAMPNILVVADTAADVLCWEALNAKLADIIVKCYTSVNMAMIDWLKMYSEDHVPRAFVFGWQNNTQSMGVLDKISPSGTAYAIDGAAFALYCCMDSVGDDSGMFVAYSQKPKSIREDISHWPESLKSRIHTINKKTCPPKDLLGWILNHKEFAYQMACHV